MTKRAKDGKKRIVPMSIGALGADISAVAPTVPMTTFSNPNSSTCGSNLVVNNAIDVFGINDSPAKRQRTEVPPSYDPSVSMGSAPVSKPINDTCSGYSNATQQHTSVIARSGQTVTNISVPGRVDDINGGVLEYSIKTDCVVSRYSLRGLSESTDSHFIVKVPPVEKPPTGRDSSALRSWSTDVKLLVRVIKRPETLSAAFGAASSSVNRGGIAVMSIVQLKKMDPKGSNQLAATEWTSVIPARATVGCALRLPQPSAPNSNPYRVSSFPGSLTGNNRHEGVVFFGSTDGTFHTISLASGLRLYPILTLGAPIVDVSCILLPVACEDNSNKTDLVPTNTFEYYCMACCADGEVIVWRIETSLYKPTDFGRTSGGRSNFLRTAFIAKKGLMFAGLSILYRANVRCLIQCLRYHDAGTAVTAKIDKIFLTSSAHLCGGGNSGASVNADLTLVAVLKSKGAINGDMQIFKFVSQSGCWSRVSDLRYFFSAHGKAPNLTSTEKTGLPIDSSINSPVDDNIPYLDMDLENLPKDVIAVNSREVAAAARILQQERIQQQLGRMTSQASTLDRLSYSGSDTVSVFDWGGLVSLCHAEVGLPINFLQKFNSHLFDFQISRRNYQGSLTS